MGLAELLIKIGISVVAVVFLIAPEGASSVFGLATLGALWGYSFLPGDE
ncbi:MAG: hypothetical protein ACI8Z7_000195 [Candidatus Nanohaloarchaea archaeon]|jgi:hypothetical protein